MRAAVVVLAVVLACLAGAQAAAACSIAGPVDPRAQLEAADAAAVVTVLERTDAPPGPDGATGSGDPTTLRMAVERAVKGDLGREVVAHTVRDTATCGMAAQEGERFGVFLHRREGRFTVSLVDRVTVRTLEEAARPLPRPRRGGRARLLVAGAFGGARTIALDRRGAIVGYGRERGQVLGIAACPGGPRALELLDGRPRARIVVRALGSMRLVGRHAVPRGGAPVAVGCADVRGRRPALLLASSSGGPGRLVVRRAGRWRRAAPGRWDVAAFAPGAALLARSTGARPVLVHLRSGRVVARAPRRLAVRDARLSADGRLAVLTADARHRLVRLPSMRRIADLGADGGATPTPLSPRRLAVLTGRALWLTRLDLDPLRRWRLPAHGTHLAIVPRGAP